MAAVPHTRPAPVSPSPHPALSRRRRAGQRAGRRAVWRGVAWIAVTAALLAGVVAVNVAVLRRNVELDELSRRRAQLRAENAALASRLASAAAAARIERQARERLGLVPADPGQTRYVDLRP